MDTNLAKLDECRLEPIRLTDFVVANHCVQRCWDEVSEDNAPVYLPDVINEYWIGLYDKDLIGCYRFNQLNAATWEIHALILPEHREMYSDLSFYSVLEWVLDYIPLKKLICRIPAKYQNVIGFAKKVGFKEEGINRMSYTKDDRLWDIHNLGLTIDEMRAI